MNTLTKGLIALVVLLAVGAGLVVWKTKVGGHGTENLTKLTKEDMQMLFKDANPLALKQLAENPEMKAKQIDGLKELLAVANQARKEGVANDPKNKPFLEFIRSQIIAVNYDREKNKDKGSMPPFSFITKEQTDAYYQNSANEEKFNALVKTIVEQSKEENPEAPEPTPEQLEQLKTQYAKVKIYEKEAAEANLGDEFKRKTELQVQLQQAAFLNQVYADKVLKDKVKVSDEEVAQYIAAHPELDPKAKKTKAEEVLQRAKAGEDFTALAKEFSEDPGSKEKGGLYDGITKGQMAPEFEQAALALEPGKVADNLVETKFGYHIIKLDKKGTTKGADGKEEETYDARHILLSTMFTDPENPFRQPMPLDEKVKADLQEEKQKKLLEEIKAKNPIEIEDFEIPKPSEEEIQEMMKKQMPQMPMGAGEEPEGAQTDEPTSPSKAPKKPEPKKK